MTDRHVPALHSAGPFRLSHILLLGLLLRVIALIVVPDQNFPDHRSYVSSGRELFSSGIMEIPVYMPLYPVWTYIWGGDWGLRLADIALSVATIWLIHRFTLVLFADKRAALLAATAAAIYPHFIFYAISGLTETAYVMIVVAAFLLLYRRHMIAGAVLLVLSILIRPALDFLAPLLLVAIAILIHRDRPAAVGKHLIAYFALYVVLMTPWWIHNFEKYGTFVRLNLGSGMVLYSGNNPLNQSGGGVGGGEKGNDMLIGQYTAIADPIARDRAMRDAALDFIRENPGRFVELAVIKFVRFWRLWPYAPEYERPVIIAVSLLSFGTMLALAIGFLATEGWAWRREIVPILLFAGYLTAVHMVTIGSIRYRLPIEPFVIVFACRSLATLSRLAPPADRLLRRIAV